MRLAQMKNTVIISVLLFSMGFLVQGCFSLHHGSADSSAPVVGTSVSFSSIGSDAVTVAWGLATDNVTSSGRLEYMLVYSLANNLNTVEEAKTNGTVFMSWTAGILTQTVTGLTPATTYHIAVLVRDERGNTALYAQQSVITTDGMTSIVISPTDLTIILGTYTQFSATALYSDSSTLDVTETATWSSDNEAVATVDAHGLVTAVGTGTTTIRVTQGLTANTTVTVTGGLTEVAGVTVSDRSNISIGSSNISRNVAIDRSLRIHAVWTTTNNGAIYYSRSTNLGISFEASVEIADGSTTADNVQPAIATSGENTVYIAYMESDYHLQLARSLDGGDTWSHTEIYDQSFGIRVSIATDGAYVYVASHTSPIKLARSDDYGTSFTTANTPLPQRSYEDVLVDPRNGDVYILEDNPSLFMVKSTDHGATFSDIVTVDTTYQVYYSDYSISQYGNIIIAGSGNYVKNAASYNINTDTWTQVNTGYKATSTQASVAVDGMNIIHIVGSYGGNVYMYSSDDQGATYDPLLIVTGATNPDIAPTTFVDGAPILYVKNDTLYYTFVKSSS